MLTDHGDFFPAFNRPLCRGNRLLEALRETREGVSPRAQKVVTGFSKNPRTCKRFAGKAFGENGEIQGPPTITLISKESLQELNPNIEEVDYSEKWLLGHQDVLEALQTILLPRATPKEKVQTAISHSDEEEWVVTDTEKAQLPDDVSLNIYIGPEELEDMGIKAPWFGKTHPWLIDGVNKVIPKLKEEIEKHAPKDCTMRVQFYSCHSTLNLFNEPESACVLHDSFRIERGERDG